MTSWSPGCCHPTGGPHGKGEPETCCHVHVEDLPSNRANQQGEPPLLPDGWTAQEQALADKLADKIAEQSDTDEVIEQLRRHRHKL